MINQPQSERVGFVSRLEAAQTSGVRVWLMPSNTAMLRSPADQRIHLQLSDGNEITGKGQDWYAAFTDAGAQLAQSGARLVACANCEFFVLSEMSYQMSAGGKGYCTIGKDHPVAAGPDDIVSILDVCDAFHYGPGARQQE
jgi:hypothetical protein